MLPPKHRHILGCLTFSEKIFVKKKTQRWSNHFLKIQWEIIFFDFFEILTETLQKTKSRIEILTFAFQICLWNKFLTLGSIQTENTQQRVFSV